MIHSIIFIGTLVAVFFYASVLTIEKSAGPAVIAEPVKKSEVVEVPKTEAPAVVAKVEVEDAPIDVENGRALYSTHCIACHNKDPNVKGAIGPELIDAPVDLMKVKVVTGRYPDVLPEGFVPKRKTKQMKKFPQLEKDVASIHAWIQSVKK